MRRSGSFVLLALLICASVLAADACRPASAAAVDGRFALAGGRSYELYAQPAATPRPLVIVLHRLGWSGADARADTGAVPYAARNGFDVAFGEGVGKMWNAGSCCGGATTDDVGYLVRLVDDVARRTPVDRSRVYVWGLSNGGMLAWRAVCERPDVFAAAGVVAGALLVPCDSTRVVVRDIHGTLDRTVPFHGGPGCCGVDFPSVLAERDRVGPGSSVVVKAWVGGHSWPAWATNWLWHQLRGTQLRGTQLRGA